MQKEWIDHESLKELCKRWEIAYQPLQIVYMDLCPATGITPVIDARPLTKTAPRSFGEDIRLYLNKTSTHTFGFDALFR
jgi:hypothetical protein